MTRPVTAATILRRAAVLVSRGWTRRPPSLTYGPPRRHSAQSAILYVVRKSAVSVSRAAALEHAAFVAMQAEVGGFVSVWNARQRSGRVVAATLRRAASRAEKA